MEIEEYSWIYGSAFKSSLKFMTLLNFDSYMVLPCLISTDIWYKISYDSISVFITQ